MALSSNVIFVIRLHISTSCQPGSQVIRALSDVEKSFFSDLAVKAVKAANQKIKKAFQRQGRLGFAAG